MAGSDVTLSCRNRSGFAVPVNFYKFGKHISPIGASTAGEFTISNVQQCDEGFYWCSTYQAASPSSRLSVRGQDTHIYFLFVSQNQIHLHYQIQLKLNENFKGHVKTSFLHCGESIFSNTTSIFFIYTVSLWPKCCFKDKTLAVFISL